MNLSGNDKKKIKGKKYQPVMSITGLNDQGLRLDYKQPTMLKFEFSIKKSESVILLGIW